MATYLLIIALCWLAGSAAFFFSSAVLRTRIPEDCLEDFDAAAVGLVVAWPITVWMLAVGYGAPALFKFMVRLHRKLSERFRPKPVPCGCVYSRPIPPPPPLPTKITTQPYETYPETKP